jgi:hypothetical protein
MSEILKEKETNSKHIESSNLNHQFMDKKEEIKFFLREYKTLSSQDPDFYYILPLKWVKLWDDYITDNTSNENYPKKIENSELIDQNNVIKQGLIENVDFVILPKSVAYFFHDVYQGGRRLKSKNRHIYQSCETPESKNMKLFCSM